MIATIQLLLFVGIIFGFTVWVFQNAGLSIRDADDFFVTLAVLCAVCVGALFLVGCDVHVNGETTHTVQGEATVRVEVAIDYCKDVPPEHKLECLETFKEIVEMMTESEDMEDLVGGVE